MKRMPRWASLIALLLVALALPPRVMEPALAFPPVQPYRPWGTVTVNGALAPDGTEATAWIGGVQYGLTRSRDGGWYAIYIPGDDPDTPTKDGGSPGEAVTFKIAGYTAAQMGTWRSGSFRLDLSANNVTLTPTPIVTIPPPPTSTPTDTPAPTHTPTPTGTPPTGVTCWRLAPASAGLTVRPGKLISLTVRGEQIFLCSLGKVEWYVNEALTATHPATGCMATDTFVMAVYSGTTDIEARVSAQWFGGWYPTCSTRWTLYASTAEAYVPLLLRMRPTPTSTPVPTLGPSPTHTLTPTPSHTPTLTNTPFHSPTPTPT